MGLFWLLPPQQAACLRRELLLTERATCWDASPPPWLRSCWLVKRSSLCDAKTSTSLAPTSETSSSTKTSCASDATSTPPVAPSKIFWRTVRGMVPHKTPRGAAALAHLKVFEGVPPPYDKVNRVVCPQALRVLRLRPGRRFTRLGRLSHEVGWKYQDTIKA